MILLVKGINLRIMMVVENKGLIENYVRIEI